VPGSAQGAKVDYLWVRVHVELEPDVPPERKMRELVRFPVAKNFPKGSSMVLNEDHVETRSKW
jgi:hypothetical protein